MENNTVLSHTRFNSVTWYGENRELTIGGAGTIGSWLTLLLARTGQHEILVYDDDTVDIENLAGQLYGRVHINMSKVDAIKEQVLELTEFDRNQLHVFKTKIVDGTYVSPVCFSAFDNMKARKAMFNNWKSKKDREIFIDGRMTIEDYQVFFVTPDNEDQYEKTLFSDKDLPDQICSLKATSHTGALIAGRMVSLFTNHLANVAMGVPMRELYFMTSENLEIQSLNQQ